MNAYYYFLAVAELSALGTHAPNIVAPFRSLSECQVAASEANHRLGAAGAAKSPTLRAVCLKLVPDA
jgi:hypothetical protein